MYLQGCCRREMNLAAFVLLLLLLMFVSPVFAGSNDDAEVALTAQEQQWLDQRMGVVTVGIAFVPPHTLSQDDDGHYRGVAMDFLALLEDKLPLNFKTRFYPSYSALLQGAEHGEVDMVFAASATPDREEYLLFTSPYTFLANKIFVRKTSPGFKTLDDLAGKTVAVIRGTAIVEHLRLFNPDIRLLELKSSRDLMLAVSSGNADAAISVVASAWWHIKREGISNLDVSGDANYSYAVRFATRKDLDVLVSMLEKGLYSISDAERDLIHRRWLHPEMSGVINKEQVYRYAGFALALFLLALVIFALFSVRRLRREVDQRLVTERALRVSEERFELAIRGTNDGIWDWNLETGHLYLAPRFLEILGQRAPECGQEWQSTEMWLQRVHPKDRALVQDAVKAHIAQHEVLDVRYRVRSEQENWLWIRMRGQALWNKQGRAVRLCGSIMDITESKRSEDEVRRLAYFDQLTGVANRERFKLSLQGAVNKLNIQGNSFAVMFVDLDHFKLINDSLGHRIGDLLLYRVAELIRRVLPPSGFLGRLDGDEFAILLDEPKDVQEIRQWAEHLQDTLTQPMILDGHDLRISASIGISHWMDGPATIEQVMEQADIALSEVKREQRGHYRFHEEQMSQRIFENTLLAKDLESAQHNGELFLMFQPQIGLQTEKVIGCEALIRWHHPERGMISPATFIPLAEERGLIHHIGRWVMNEACRQARRWLDQGVDFGGIGVNVSSLQLLAQGFVEQVEAILERHQLPAQYIELEITETVLVQDIRQAEMVMNRLRALGLRFSIDDFGTGYSSLLYLQRLPIGRLKLAQEFVRDTMIAEGMPGQNEAVVAAALQLGKNLKIPVIAEGIETFAQFEWLKQQGCDEGQGYLFAKPMMAADFRAFIHHTESHGILPVPVDPESTMMVS
ncbi:EAL domain-containing protein [Oceanospirillum sanctuarii]|uniref:EAL domain-containing protein n=1 Tax=Oceanospirillum sanctuarii TaxID=1434821 RepID=UPI000A36C925|nr:EAL domain-containing protein [Oceanospirillum sanctuarii]